MLAFHMGSANINDLARELREARDQLTGVPSAVSARGFAFDLDAAYSVEAEIMRHREAAGHRAKGRKVGYANKAMWRILKLDTLVWARMYEDTVHFAERNSAELPVSSFFKARLEPEIVFKLKTAPESELDAERALATVEWVALGFEIIDCPFPDWEIKPEDFVAAYGLHRALVVGEPQRVDPAAIPELVDQLAKFKLSLSNAGEVMEQGAGKNSLCSPAACLAELATAAMNRYQPLQAGELISTGTLSKAPDIVAGQSWTVELEGLDLPSLNLRFS